MSLEILGTRPRMTSILSRHPWACPKDLRQPDDAEGYQKAFNVRDRHQPERETLHDKRKEEQSENEASGHSPWMVESNSRDNSRPPEHCQNQYLNNVIESEHRRIG